MVAGIENLTQNARVSYQIGNAVGHFHFFPKSLGVFLFGFDLLQLDL